MATPMWYEFPMVNEDGNSSVVGHLHRILGIATKLAAAGWPMDLALTGLSFDPPSDDEVAQQLAGLGITESFTVSSRSLAEVCEVLGQLHDQERRGATDFEEGRLVALRWAMGS